MEIKELTGIEIKNFFDGLSPDELLNESYLTEFILKQVGVGFRFSDFDIKEGEYLPSYGYKLKIWPDEMARLLIMLYPFRNEINSFLEFGTGSGGSFFLIDGFLRSVNKNMKESLTIDMNNRVPRGFAEYQKIYPVRYIPQKINSSMIDRHYDLCFIDADHTYKAAKRDYEMVKDKCKFIVFHDILLVSRRKPDEWGVRHLWKEIDGKKTDIKTIDPRISFMSGIGFLDNREHYEKVNSRCS